MRHARGDEAVPLPTRRHLACRVEALAPRGMAWRALTLHRARARRRLCKCQSNSKINQQKATNEIK